MGRHIFDREGWKNAMYLFTGFHAYYVNRFSRESLKIVFSQSGKKKKTK